MKYKVLCELWVDIDNSVLQHKYSVHQYLYENISQEIGDNAKLIKMRVIDMPRQLEEIDGKYYTREYDV